MRLFSILLSLVCAATLSLRAQVAVEVLLDQDKFLPGEQLIVGIRITNRSGQSLHLGEDVDWIKYSIEKLEGGVVHEINPPPVQGAFDLGTTERATIKVDLAPCFELRQQGRYILTATVKIKEWNRALITKASNFDIVEGTKLWEQEFGVPRPEGDTQPPEVRKYTLQTANYLRTQLRLYLRVSMTDGHVIKLINVGPMISFGQPEPQLDRQNRLHLLYQNGAKTFDYVVVDPDGEIKMRQVYEYTATRPRLRLDDSGEIKVVDGARRVTAGDLPAEDNTKDDGKLPKP